MVSMSKMDREQKEILRVANCLIPIVDPTEEQSAMLMQEYSYQMDKINANLPNREQARGWKDKLQELIGYLFSVSSKR